MKAAMQWFERRRVPSGVSRASTSLARLAPPEAARLAVLDEVRLAALEAARLAVLKVAGLTALEAARLAALKVARLAALVEDQQVVVESASSGGELAVAKDLAVEES